MVVDDAIKKEFEKDSNATKGHLVKHMTNHLFNLFVTYKFAKEIWDSLENKYSVDNARNKNILSVMKICQ